MIRETITTINEELSGLATGVVQVSGLASVFDDQAEKTTSLRCSDGSRFSLDDAFGLQSLHLPSGNVPAKKQTFGSFTDTTYNVGLVLVGVSQREYDYTLAITALKSTPYVVVDGFDTDTLRVLTQYLRIKTGPDKNYDPDLWAWAIRYHIEGVCEEDLLATTND